MVSVRKLAASASLITLLAVPAKSSETTTFQYDALGRLVSSGNSGGPRDGRATTTGYDEAGNRTVQAVGIPAPPITNTTVFSVSGPSAAVAEGGVATFLVSRSGTAGGNTSINFTTVNATAASPTDFTGQSGTLTFRAWERVQTISIPTLVDTLAEGVEQFSLQLQSPSSGASIGTASAVAQIGTPNGGNQPPVATNDSVSVGICETVERDVIANDSDPEGNVPLTVLSVTSSTRGSAYVASASSIGFAAYGTAGSTQVTYTVRDSLGATSTGVLSITVVNGAGCS